MTPGTPATACALCGGPATETIEAPRRTLARGPDPGDPSYSLTVILPDIELCLEHALQVREGTRLIGWCDDPRCRTYGEVGEASSCGNLYGKLGTSKRV